MSGESTSQPTRVLALLSIAVAATLGVVPAAAESGAWTCEPAPEGGWACAHAGPLPPASPPPAGATVRPGTAHPVEATAASSPAARLDWVGRERLTEARQRELPAWHDGAYVETPLPAGAREGDPDTLHAEADRASWTLDEQASLSGDVTLRQGTRQVRAGTATLDQAADRASLADAVVLREPGLLMRGDSAEYQIDSGDAHLADAEFVMYLPAIRGTAVAIAKNGSGDLAAERARFTRCEPGNDDSWMVTARTLNVRKGAVYGVARDVVLRIRDVPVFYSPYFSFPVSDERTSGFLFPELGYSSTDGTDFRIPYYFNLAPNYDLTVAPRLMSKRGVGLDGEFRHLAPSMQNSVSGAFLPSDDAYDGRFSRDDFRDLGLPGRFHPADRWLVRLDHAGQFGPVSSRIDFAEVSDSDYFSDLGGDIAVTARSEIERKASFDYANDWLTTRLWAQSFRNLDELRLDPYDRLPQLEVTVRQPLAGGRLVASLHAQGAGFDRDEDGLVGVDALVGERYHIEPRLTLPMSWPFGYLNASAAFRHTRWTLDHAAPGIDDRPERNIVQGRIDGGLVFERETRMFGSDWLQVLEPRITALYTSREDQDLLPRFDSTLLTLDYAQLFRDNRFSGLDRVSDAAHVVFGVTTRFLDSTSGAEYFTASLGQVVHLRDRDVTLFGTQGPDETRRTSPLVGEVVGYLSRHWTMVSRLAWSTEESDPEQYDFTLSWRDGPMRLLNFGYIRANQSLDQPNVSFYWPVATRWNAMGRVLYDLRNDGILEAFAGLEYNNCCWRIRLLYREFVTEPSRTDFEDTDRGIFLQFVLKGLAGFGGNADEVLRNGILGFDPDQLPD